MSWDERPKWEATSDNYASVTGEALVGFLLFFSMIAYAHDYHSLAGIPFGLLGCCLIYVAWQEVQDKIELARHGKLTVGKIVGGWRGTDSDGPEFFVAYEYGNGYRAFQDVSWEDSRRLYPGSRVSVLYLPEKPRVSRMERF